tara:strand:+ start:80 stop:946 length:867 start_codon:yes stop_codon:yes gene_type:complete
VQALIIGCGYVGEALGQRLVALGHDVTGIRRSREQNGRLAKLGIRPLNIDITEEGALAKLDGRYDWVVIAVSSARGGEAAYKRVFELGTRQVAQWLKTAIPSSTVFISSTNVYRQTNTEQVVEEDSDTTGKTPGKAEQIISEAGSAVGILRSSGIYGPDRSHLFRQFMSGNAVVEGNGSRYLNMVHRDDLVEAIILTLESDGGGGVFNITDDEPVTQLDFFQWLSNTTGRPMPPFVPEPNAAIRKRGITNKRVSNELFKQTFGFGYSYPTFREGLTVELNRLAKGKTI